MRALVLAGLGEHWGAIDESLNPDLDDITGVYHEAGAAIVVAECDGELVGCGVLIDEPPDAGRLVRLSVRGDQRGQGLGKQLVFALLDGARLRGYARRLRNHRHLDRRHRPLHPLRLREVAHRSGDVHFEIDLGRSS
ncbi:MAG: GNAT family N-acetyltransferase [Thermomicrobiales bacterium]